MVKGDWNAENINIAVFETELAVPTIRFSFGSLGAFGG
jgi:hypothetical protein